MEPFQPVSQNGVLYFSLIPWLKDFPHLIAGFSHRAEENVNYALHVADDPDRVIRNRKALAAALGVPFSAWTAGEQVHGVNVAWVNSEDRGRGRESQKTAFPKTDGLLTDEVDILLTSYYADCVPLFFYSPDLDIVGIAHAGWRGTVAKIGPTMVQKLITCGARIENLRIAIGPSIGPCCYEVDERVIHPLKQALSSDALPGSVAQPQGTGRYRLDLKEANARLLFQLGIREDQVLISQWCTSCYPRYFFSYRRDQDKAGRMVAFIGKKKREGILMLELAQRWEAVKKRIEHACYRVGRDPKEVQVVAVTKYVGLERTKAVLDIGLEHIGESRVQDAVKKWQELGNVGTWHFIGRLQRNKVKDVVQRFSYLHSLDRYSLAEELEKRGRQLQKTLKCFIQVNVSGETTKTGISPQELQDFALEVANMSHIEVIGLMTMAPLTENPEETRPVFRELKRWQQKLLNLEHPRLPVTHLSMGMSQDFEVAIEEGATWLRLGSILVGNEPGGR